MNLNPSNNFLIHDKETLVHQQQPLSHFSSTTLLSDNLTLLGNGVQEVFEIESSASNSIYEFIQPKVKQNNQVIHRMPQTSSPKKETELNLVDYFKSLQMLQNVNDRHLKILKKITLTTPPNGNISLKTSPQNKLENVVYFNHATSKLINYNILGPSALGLIGESSTNLNDLQEVPLKRKVGRPRNDTKKLFQQNQQHFVSQLDEDMISHRTKYGRVIKLNKDVAKILQVDQEIMGGHEIHQIPIQVPPQQPEILPALELPRKQRKISSEFRCTTCKKVYLGRNKMNHHLKLHPDHRASHNESSLFSHLMKLVRQKKNNQDMANLFFKELSSFVQQCEKFTPKLITSMEHPNVHPHVIDKNSASVLRINPGEYKLNMSVFDKDFKFDNNPIEEEEQRVEEKILMNNSGTIEEENHHELIEANSHEVIKALDDVPSLDCHLNEVNLLIRQTNELTNLTNISDIIINDAKIEHEGDNALLGFLN